MATQTRSMTDILDMGPVMPVIVIDHAEDGVALADALLAGGLKTIEVTLRTPAALCAIKAIAEASPNICIGAGTVISAELAHAAKEAGAHFVVSPGTTQAVIDGCAAADLPLLPGASTVSEMMHMLEAGFTAMKFFPASATGGTSFIKSLASPLPQITICPTGGISATTAPDWLALPNVKCVGGSWVAPRRLINAGDFAAIEALARDAASLAD
jgi:2-dehydro-3-deoxyphosphogluconate aldolase/(4S)-4-hydroxy-2-oxoglutarate aldolase